MVLHHAVRSSSTSYLAVKTKTKNSQSPGTEEATRTWTGPRRTGVLGPWEQLQRLALLDGGSSDFWPPRVRTAWGLASALRPPFAAAVIVAAAAATAAAWPLVPLQEEDKAQVSARICSTSRSMCCTKMCFWRVMAGRGALTRVSTCNSWRPRLFWCFSNNGDWTETKDKMDLKWEEIN